MKIKIHHKLLGMAFLASFLPIVIIMFLSISVKNSIQEQLEDTLDLKARSEISLISRNVYNMCKLVYQAAPENEKVKETLRKEIAKIVVGKTGYVYILGAEGDRLGHYILSKNMTRDGENIWNAEDAHGRRFIQEMIRKAKDLDFDEVAFEEYPWKNFGEDKERVKIAALTYFKPWGWVIGAGAYWDELSEEKTNIADALSRLIRAVLIAGLITFLIIMLGAYFGGKKLAKPLEELAIAADRLGEGDLEVKMNYRNSDEIGNVASAFLNMAANMKNLILSIRANSETLQNNSGVLRNVSRELSSNSKVLNERSQQFIQTAEAVNDEVTSISSAVEQAAGNTNVVAQSAGEMTSTIQEIASNTEQARTISQSAVAVVGEAVQNVRSLNDTAQTIERIIEVIVDIADQTKLLALNATIEAARAGDAGKGFAVVASEVKELARQTGEASEDIRSKIAAIKSSIENTTQQINQINGVIEQVDDTVSAIASAVEEQSVTTNEISQNINEAALGLKEIASNAARTNDAMQQMNTDSEQIKDASVKVYEQVTQVTSNAEDLAGISAQLMEMVSRFKVKVEPSGTTD